MKQRIIILVIFCIFDLNIAYSQTITEIRQIKTTALDVYEKYVSIMANLYNNNVYNEDRFLELFYENAQIYNDILPDNKPQELSPKEYFDKFKQNINTNDAEYSELEFKLPTRNELNKWSIECTFKKKINYRSKKEYCYPKWEFKYSFIIEMDSIYNNTNKIFQNAKIRSIEVEFPLDQFFIIENKNNLKITIYNEPVEDFNGENNGRIFDRNECNISDFEFHINDDSNFFYLREKKWDNDKQDEHFFSPAYSIDKSDLLSIGLNYSFLCFGYPIKSNNMNGITSNSKSLSLSFLYGLQITHKNSSNLFLNMGLDANWNNNNYKGSNYTEYNDIDSDNDSYLRKITINSLNEDINSISSSFRLSSEYIFQLNKAKDKRYFISFEIGAFADYSLLLQSEYNLNVDYHGFYDYFGGIEFDHYYDYGNFDVSGKKNLIPICDHRLNFDLFCELGFWIEINTENLFKLDLGYRHGLYTTMKYNENFIITSDSNSYESLFQSSNQGLRDVYFGLSFIKLIRPIYNRKK